MEPIIQSQDQELDQGECSNVRPVASACSLKSVLKRNAAESPEQTPFSKRFKRTIENTRRVTFSHDSKEHDAGKVNRLETPTPIKRMVEMGLDHTIPLRYLNQACEECLGLFSDAEDLLLLSLYAKGRQADDTVINRIEKKLAIALCSDFLLDAPSPCSYDKIQSLYQSLESEERLTLDKADAECLSILRDTILARATRGNLLRVLKKYKFCSLLNVCKLYLNYYSTSFENRIDRSGKTREEADAELNKLINSETDNFFQKLTTVIPDNILVLQFLKDHAPE